jgi:O-antigen ligase
VETWFDGVVLPAVVFLAVSRYAVTLDRVQRLAASLMVAGGILGAIGLAERVFGFELATLSGGQVRQEAEFGLTRVSGPYPVPEPYALALVMCLAATLYWTQTQRRGLAMWGIVFAALEVGGISFSLFRAAWIAGLLVFIGALGIRPRRFGRTLAVTAVVAALAGGATTQLQHNQAFEERTQNTSNIYGRLATYQEGVTIFQGAPLAGIGVDNYHQIALERKPTVYHRIAAVNWPHSSYIGVLAEQGLLGFIPLLLASLGAWFMIRRLRSLAITREDGILAGALAGAGAGYMIMSLTLTMLPYEPSNAFFALLLGMGAARLNAISAERASVGDPAVVRP